MDNQLAKNEGQKTYFKVMKGSNYKVTQINRKEHIIEYGHFLKLAKILNDTDIQFVSINNNLVNKNRIEDISPTKEKTEEQKELVKQKAKQKAGYEQEVKRFKLLLAKFKKEAGYDINTKNGSRSDFKQAFCKSYQVPTEMISELF